MSSDEFSKQPMPSDKRCPHCGKAIAANESECRMCRDKLAIREGPAPAATPTPGKAWAGDDVAWAFLGGVAIFVCAATAFFAPGILILLLVLATPALVRAGVAGSRETAPSKFAGGPNFFTVFLSSLGITTVVLLAVSIAFFATCFAVGFGVMGVTNSLEGITYAFVFGSIAGAIPGLALAIFLFRRLYPFK
jgi:hypothetical protein